MSLGAEHYAKRGGLTSAGKRRLQEDQRQRAVEAKDEGALEPCGWCAGHHAPGECVHAGEREP